MSRRYRLVCYPVHMEFRVEEQDGEIIVTDGVFTAVYHKPDKLDPQLKLKSRSPTDDHALRARAWIAAVSKARELGWICVMTRNPAAVEHAVGFCQASGLMPVGYRPRALVVARATI